MSLHPVVGWDYSPECGATLLKHFGDGPLLTAGATGVGKTRRVALPELVTYEHSTIVCDFQDGQLTRETALWRHHVLGQNTLVIDPGNVVDPKWIPKRQDGSPCHARVDPIDYIRRSKLALSETIRLAQAFVPPGTLKDAHWSKGGQLAMSAYMLFVAFDPAIEELGWPRTMGTVQLILSDPKLEKETLRMMLLSNIGIVREQAGAFLRAGKDSHEMAGIRNQIRVSCSEVLSEQAFLDCLTGTNIDFVRMRTEPTTLYLVLPGRLATSHAMLPRIILAMALGDIEAAGLLPYSPEQRRILVQIDEYVVLGRFPIMVDTLARGRGYGIQPHLFIQSLGQLKELYGDGLSSIMGNIDLLTFFGGTNDQLTAELISKRCGVDTFVEADVGQSGRPGDAGSIHYKTFGRPNLMPDEVMRFPLPEQLLLPKGQSPLKGLVFDANLCAFPEFVAFRRCLDAGNSIEQAKQAAAQALRGNVPAPRDPVSAARSGLIDRLKGWLS